MHAALRPVHIVLSSQLAPSSHAYEDGFVVTGGVSSFGLGGTIAHTILAVSSCEAVAKERGLALQTDDERSLSNRFSRPPFTYRRRVFPWRDPTNPFALLYLSDPTNPGAIVCRTPLASFSRIVADHIVHAVSYTHLTLPTILLV